MAELVERQRFWRTLFEEKEVASALASISAKADGENYHISHYGDVSLKCRPASSLGDNFMSDTFIVMATTQEGKSFRGFVKVLPSNKLMRDAAYGSRVHHREINMYRTFFGVLRQVRLDAGLSDQDVPLDVPDVYHVHLEEVVKGETDGSGTAVLLQDLSTNGYRMTDKMEGCDDTHARLALTSLAHYHALNMAALRKWKNPDGSYSYPPEAEFLLEKTMFDMNIGEMFKEQGNNIANRPRNVGREDLAKWTEEKSEHFPEIFAPDTIESCGPLICILHGDYWNNNMLFKYDTNDDRKPVAVKMIDFQISRVSHPICDILYFLYTSTLPELREKYMTAWLAHYFDTLTSSLKKLAIDLNEEGYHFSDFMADYKKRSLTWMFSAASVMLMVLDKNVVTNLEDMDKEAKANPVPENDEETIIGASGMSVDLEEKMKSFVAVTDIKKSNPAISIRVTKLIEEVKNLIES